MDERSVEPIATALGRLLRDRRMSQTDLWAAANLSSSTVSLYLNGKRGTAIDHRGAETIERMAAVLDVDPSYFVEYRMWQIRQAAKLYPDLANEVYDVLMAFVDREPGGLDSLKSKG